MPQSSAVDKILSSIKKKRAHTSVELPPTKYFKIRCNSMINENPVIYREIQQLPENIAENDTESNIKQKYLGSCSFELMRATETRKDFLVRKIDNLYVSILKNEIVNNKMGQYFRPKFVLNIYAKNKNEVANFNEDEYNNSYINLKEGVTQLHLASDLFHKYFCYEILDGNHSYQALCSILNDANINEATKKHLGSPDFLMEGSFYLELERHNALSVAVQANKTISFAKPLSTFETIKAIYDYYQNKNNLVDRNAIDGEKKLMVDIKKQVIKTFFTPKVVRGEIDYKPYNSKIKFCSMPQIILEDLEQISDYKLTDVMFNLNNISSLRFWDCPEGFHTILTTYLKEINEIVNKFIDIEQQSRRISFKVLIEEVCKEQQKKIRELKKKVINEKKHCISELDKLRIDSKCALTMLSVIQGENEFPDHIKELDTSHKLFSYCLENKIPFDTLIDDQLRATVMRSRKTVLEDAQKKKVVQQLLSNLVDDCSSAVKKLVGADAEVSNLNNDRSCHKFLLSADSVSPRMCKFISLLLISCRLLPEVQVVHKLIASYPGASIVILHKKEFLYQLHSVKEYRFRTLCYCQVKNDGTYQSFAVTYLLHKQHIGPEIDHMVFLPGPTNIPFLKYFFSLSKLHKNSAVLIVDGNDCDGAVACASLGFSSISIVAKERKAEEFVQTVKDFSFINFDPIPITPIVILAQVQNNLLVKFFHPAI